MVDLDTWQEIGETLRRNKLRTLLTALGVFWGMFMLMLMLGLGGGLQEGALRNMSSYATNAVWMRGGRSSLPFAGMQPGREVDFRLADVDALRQELPGLALVCPRQGLGGWRDGVLVSREGKSGSYQVNGDVPEFTAIQPIELVEGRFINALDMAGRRKVAVIGARVAEELFERGEPVMGASIEVQGVWFLIVGVFRASADGDLGDRQNGTIHLPLSTFQRAFNTGDRVGWLALVGEPEADAAALEAGARRILSERHALHPDDDPAIRSWNQAEDFGRMRSMFGGIRVFVAFVGAVTLASGVVGVGNIMLIAVRERTRELGLRRAVGATATSVLLLILREAVVITAAAGYAGLVVAVLALEALGRAVGEGHAVLGNPQVDLTAAAGAGLALVVGGALAGLVPARQAARVDPVEALRAE